ncbi:hypothetical protein [Mucilaginibacter xinganensis]|uniref:Uncharacterized protein n=1 Tax=Mucilaginibacter xinganensis TaxID=1234841 RepID=A0A223NZF2_9SPHI|nr:hypothetical protein [Mucilaginibacter xinganensis]ASU35235.1 hypothetical protein MuYL_3350 [Mucilaginibacter xinganensis]
MKKLNYNVYTNINDTQYLTIRDKLVLIELKMEQALKGSGWNLKDPIIAADGLTINFVINDSVFLGNLGILFEDAPDSITFEFFVSKSYDYYYLRHFLSCAVFKHKGFDFFESDILKFINEALGKYNSWSMEQIVESGRKGGVRH